MVKGHFMLTYTTMKNMYLDGTGQSGSTDTKLINFFTRQLGVRYQLVLAELSIFKAQRSTTQDTEANTQYYNNPIDLKTFESVTVTVGGIAYPLACINSQDKWDRINQTLVSVTTIPQYYFPRRDDFGIWPIPRDTYTITENYLYRDKNLTQEDVTGNFDVTNDVRDVAGSGFTADMVGRFFSVDSNGFWYRIGEVVDDNNLVLDRKYEGTGGTFAGTIGEIPMLPDEVHTVLVDGVLCDFYGMFKKDQAANIWFNNMFWTGDGNNNDRTGRNIQGGLIGARNRYAARSDSKVVKHLDTGKMKSTYPWGVTLSM